jgi:1-acyl-sn-glycerol-3-phosphate acyltransferase
VASAEQNIVIHSAVKQHENNNNHRIDWINCNIIARDNKNYQLLVKESLLINKLKPTLNKTTCSVPLIIFPEGLRTNKLKVKIKSTFDTLPHAEGLVL